MIIGNPPFLGAKLLKPERGPDYVNAVRKAYPEVPGMADYCVYWFRHAHDHLPACTADDPVRGPRRARRHAEHSQQPIPRRRPRPRRQDRHDCRSRRQSAVVRRSERSRLDRQLGQALPALSGRAGGFIPPVRGAKRLKSAKPTRAALDRGDKPAAREASSYEKDGVLDRSLSTSALSSFLLDASCGSKSNRRPGRRSPKRPAAGRRTRIMISTSATV